MSAEHISNTIKALKEESVRIQTEEKQDIPGIDELINKLESEINTERPQSLTDQLSTMIESTEVNHPRITLILNDLMMKLASIGI